MTSLSERLAGIQKTLNVPKSQENKFGGYMYRSCEDILMAVKPLLDGLVITINDEIVPVLDRVYVKATATISDGKDSITTCAYAREAVSKKGMDDAQVTGSTSSYARKYALNGLLLIDDNKDADHHDNRDQGKPAAHTASHQGDQTLHTALKSIANAPSKQAAIKHGKAAWELAETAEQYALITAAVEAWKPKAELAEQA